MKSVQQLMDSMLAFENSRCLAASSDTNTTATNNHSNSHSFSAAMNQQLLEYVTALYNAWSALAANQYVSIIHSFIHSVIACLCFLTLTVFNGTEKEFKNCSK